MSECSENVVESISIKPSWPRMLEFEKRNKESLQRLVSAFRLLKHYASVSPNQACAAIKVDTNKSLRIFSLDDFYKKHAGEIHDGFWRRFWASATPVASPQDGTTTTLENGGIISRVFTQKGAKRPKASRPNLGRQLQDASIVDQQRARNAALFQFKTPPKPPRPTPLKSPKHRIFNGVKKW